MAVVTRAGEWVPSGRTGGGLRIANGGAHGSDKETSMTDHAPLTDAHLRALADIERNPRALSIAQIQAMPELEFLARAGYVKVENGFQAYQPQDSTFRYSRSSKPLPAS